MKEFGFKRKIVLMVYFIKSQYSPLYINHVKYIKHELPTNQQALMVYYISSKSIDIWEKMNKEVLLPNTTVTLNVCQGHSNWHQTMKSGEIYHYTQSERKRSVNIRTLTNLRVVIFFPISIWWNHLNSFLPRISTGRINLNMRFIRPVSLDSRPNQLKTLRTNWHTSSSFLAHLWSSMKVKVNLTSIQVQNPVISIMILSLKQIGS